VLAGLYRFSNGSWRIRSVIKILHVITGLGQGGAEGVLRRLVLADRTNRHLIVFLAGWGQANEELHQRGIPVIPLGLSRGSEALLGVFRIRQVIAVFRPQVVQTWMYHADLLGALAARTSGTPVLWNLRNAVVEAGKTGWRTWLVVRINGLLSRFLPELILANGYSPLDIHRRAGFCVDRARVIPNGFDTRRFRPLPRVPEKSGRWPGLSGHCPVLGMIARWDPYKDHGTLLHALQLLKKRGQSFRCLLVGTGMAATNAALMRMIRQRKLLQSVLLLGPQDNTSAIFNRIDINVLSSSSEAFPNVLGEAMACGVPCVTTNVGEAANIVGTTGWVVQSSDPVALANAITEALRAMRNRKAWLARKRKARARIVRNYSLKTMVQAYRQVWDEVSAKARI